MPPDKRVATVSVRLDQEVIMLLNFYAGWLAFLAGIIAGAISGMKFYSEEFLGGYGSWRRRMVRLAHIAFFGLGLINLAFALTVRSLDISTGLAWPSILFVVGAVAMPAVCYLSAFKPVFRHLFFIPVLSVLIAILFTLWKVVSI